MRIGHGYDVHRFSDDETGGEQKLGGVAIPVTHRLLAHSDGDVVLHALADAVLGALGRGDIGEHFPDTDAAWSGADSAELLRTVWKFAEQAGFGLANLDLTIVAQAPKLSPYKAAMRERIAGLLGVTIDQVNVKATTTEKLGFVGRREGIATYAVVLLCRH
ncbi:2-C-methyl-D-erythritol 2,4-cyclodiphosphate synthase [Salinispirillum sp. LH 10-3-1]|uniref:2-C-methyl-D-erythritol 2,4-cyclodiphosphate synthase n=1 Tax=Salinispirillum sp. LH 10-3-1 TaxID=2952525 RepID=A0AB38YK59_9GAMM